MLKKCGVSEDDKWVFTVLIKFALQSQAEELFPKHDWLFLWSPVFGRNADVGLRYDRVFVLVWWAQPWHRWCSATLYVFSYLFKVLYFSQEGI